MVKGPSYIVFASTYPPVVCGIGKYTERLVQDMPGDRVAVVAFDPDCYGAPVEAGYVPEARVRVTYRLARPTVDPRHLVEAVRDTGADLDRTVLWFQYAGGIWPRFPDLLASMDGFPLCKIASLHTVHFQSPETPWGLPRSEYQALQEILPRLDCSTVFTIGAQRAMQRAFPRHAARVVLLRHAMEASPAITRDQARRSLIRYLERVRSAVRPTGSAQTLLDALADPASAVIGAFGFIQWDKGFRMAYTLRDALGERLRGRRILGLVMGSLREPEVRRNQNLLAQLETAADGRNRFLVSAMPPDPVFRAAFKAVDINVFWPDSPTQSGRLAHALGMGAVIVGRDIEGVGEELREVGAPVCRDFDELVEKAVRLLNDEARADAASMRARRYAAQYSWVNQASRHPEIADALVKSGESRGQPVQAH